MVPTMGSFENSHLYFNNMSNDDSLKPFDFTFKRSSYKTKKTSMTKNIETPVIIHYKRSIFSTFLNRFKNTGKGTIVKSVKPRVDSSDGSGVYKALKQMQNGDDRQKISYRHKVRILGNFVQKKYYH